MTNRVCPSCGAENSASNGFCSNCHTFQWSDPPASAATVPVAEPSRGRRADPIPPPSRARRTSKTPAPMTAAPVTPVIPALPRGAPMVVHDRAADHGLRARQPDMMDGLGLRDATSNALATEGQPTAVPGRARPGSFLSTETQQDRWPVGAPIQGSGLCGRCGRMNEPAKRFCRCGASLIELGPDAHVTSRPSRTEPVGIARFRSGLRSATGRRWQRFDRPVALRVQLIRVMFVLLIVVLAVGLLTPTGQQAVGWVAEQFTTLFSGDQAAMPAG